MRLEVYIDVYGRVGICEKFPDDEEHEGLNELLEELVDENFNGDTFSHLSPGFYMAEFSYDCTHGHLPLFISEILEY